MTVPAASDDACRIDAVVRSVAQAGADTVLVRLASAGPATLPPYEPGAHIAIECGEAGVRHYSLTGPNREAGVYDLGIKRAPEGRGGSRWLFEQLRAGTQLRISAPRNHFPLAAQPGPALFLSGGIGFTPIAAMLFRLSDLGRRARLVHMCRASKDLAFADWLAELGSFHDVHLHFDSSQGRMFDLDAELERAPVEAEIYCCGPVPMMEAVRAWGQRRGCADRCHFEFFSAPVAKHDVAGDAEFVVVQSSTGRRIPVASDQTMLAALRSAGIDMKSECEYGVCGWCAVGVLDGAPAHFDSYLTAAEKEANQLVLPCVSRCTSPTLTLDL